MLKLYTWVQSYFRSDEGATMVEYGLMVALIAVAAIVAITLIGTNLSALFNSIGVKLGVVAT